ncbi:prepilin-type N-terminal cleavage/methylation domain-containing protein [Horticoccus luteus]|uniref:Prepilin-type N-terminal cleavage/methylation domain-containing protein n=1 Tax=Horticoccus luteus TaxID=2862869 RepID=A0A8F9TW04_9BACT|nr:prepilin-type N-terminal cleavage/methylation domain-containing protein [Horticoccus luteus]QYM80115.1 prepilin-type N-terminal cleavage/methylation domain-containing protein [Horticoccus luteus]
MRLRRRGFTLVELLVVIGIIALTAGVLGMAFRGASASTGLQAAQNCLATVLAGARGQAALGQAEAAVIVDADPASATYLRAVGVATRQSGATQFVFAGDWLVLPDGVYIVPPNSASAGTSFEIDSGAGGAWTPESFSSLLAPSNSDVRKSDGTSAGMVMRLDATISPVGRVTSAGEVRLAVAAARRSADTIIFGHPAAERGVLVSAYGAVIFVNDASAF